MMHTYRLIMALTALICMGAGVASSEEALFDTATAARHMEKGISYLKAHKIDSAIAEFEASAEAAPEAEAFYYLGYAYYLKGRSGDGDSRELSRENFEKAYEIDPNFSPARLKATVPAPQAPAAPPAAPAPSSPSGGQKP